MILQVRKEHFNIDCWSEILSIFTEHGHHVKNYHIIKSDVFINGILNYLPINRNMEFQFNVIPKIQEFLSIYQDIMLIQDVEKK